MVLYKMLPPDFNAPLIAEQIVSSCFAVNSKHLDSTAVGLSKKYDLASPRVKDAFFSPVNSSQKKRKSP